MCEITATQLGKRQSLVKLGAVVRHHRLNLGLSQEKLAEICELHPNYIGRIERGNQNLTFLSLLKLAKGLKITISSLTKGL